jgi:transcriptional regulator with XRE-family HTH domain
MTEAESRVEGGSAEVKRFVERVRKVRQDMGWTSEQFAERCGLSRQAVTKWFGRNPGLPSGATLLRLSKATNRPVDWLLGVSEDAPANGLTEARLLVFLEPLNMLREDPAVLALQRGAGPSIQVALDKANWALAASLQPKGLAKSATQVFCSAFQKALRVEERHRNRQPAKEAINTGSEELVT